MYRRGWPISKKEVIHHKSTRNHHTRRPSTNFRYITRALSPLFSMILSDLIRIADTGIEIEVLPDIAPIVIEEGMTRMREKEAEERVAVTLPVTRPEVEEGAVLLETSRGTRRRLPAKLRQIFPDVVIVNAKGIVVEVDTNLMRLRRKGMSVNITEAAGTELKEKEMTEEIVTISVRGQRSGEIAETRETETTDGLAEGDRKRGVTGI